MYTTKKSEDKELSVVLFDEELRDVIVPSRKLRVYKTLRTENLVDHKNIFVASKASNLLKLSKFIREANKKNHLKALFIRSDVKKEIVPKLMDNANVRSLRNTIINEGSELVERVLNAWKNNAEDKLIADASVIDNTLYVLSCSLKMYEISFNNIPALKKIQEEFRNDFTIAGDGRYIHWEHDDIHVDIETLEYYTNEDFRKEADIKKLQYYKNVGETIKQIRKDLGISQSKIPGMSARQVRRIESGESSITVKALEKIATGHNMSLKEYLNLFASRMTNNKA